VGEDHFLREISASSWFDVKPLVIIMNRTGFAGGFNF
jgi:hypothetical protein